MLFHALTQKRCLSPFQCRESCSPSAPPASCKVSVQRGVINIDKNEMWTCRIRLGGGSYIPSHTATVHVNKTDRLLHEPKQCRENVDPQDGKTLVAMVNAWMYESECDSGISLSPGFTCAERQLLAVL